MNLAAVLCVLLPMLSGTGVAGQKAEAVPRIVLQAGAFTPRALSPDGQWLAVTPAVISSAPELVIVEAATGRRVRSYPCKQVLNVVFGPDSRSLVVTERGGSVAVIDIDADARRATLEARAIGPIAFVDPRTIAVATREKSVEFWSLTTLQPAGASIALTSEATALACSVDGSTIAVACPVSDAQPKSGLERGPAAVRVWRIKDLREREPLVGHENEITTMSFRPDGRMLATAGYDKSVRLWDLESSSPTRILRGHELLIWSVAFTADGARLISIARGIRASDSPAGNLFELLRWNVASGQVEHSVAGPERDTAVVDSAGACIARETEGRIELERTSDEHSKSIVMDRPDTCYSVAFSPAGQNLLVKRSNGGVQIWDARNGRVVETIPGKGHGPLLVTSDGRKAIIGGFETRVVSLESGKELVSGLPPAGFALSMDPKLGTFLSGNGTIALSPDGSEAAFAETKTQAITLVDLATGTNRLVVGGRTDVARAIAYSPDGKRLAVGLGPSDQALRAARVSPIPGQALDTRCRVTLLDASTGLELKTLGTHGDIVSSIAFSPDGKLVASSSFDQTVIVWDVEAGRAVLTLRTPLAGFNFLSFSPDGSRLATCASDEVQLWEIAGGKLLKTLRGHKAVVSSVAFRPDGSSLASSSLDGSVAIWDVESGDRLVSLYSVSNGEDWLAVSPDGLFDGTPGGWKKILWRFSDRIDDVAPVEAFFGDFFAPGLLADVLDGKRPRAATSLATKDRRLPTVRVSIDRTSTAARAKARHVEVRIDVKAASSTGYDVAGPGARDVRLFRNGTLVKAWRGEVLGRGRTSTVLRTRVPIVAGPNRFVAYAFNRDNIKSEDATAVATGPPGLARKGTAHVLAIGVSSYAYKGFDLRFARSDAQAFAHELRDRLSGLGEFERIEVTTLLDGNATKGRILAALGRLGTPPDSAVQPEDAVIVLFAGHGLAEGDRYYLVTHDSASGALPRIRTGRGEQHRILERSISDRELESAFENLQAGRIVLVIDACYSGKALDSSERRLGPMNSRGLAQLAYEKGIFVLTASQSSEMAFESPTVRHGFLTYALVEEGLKTAVADTSPTDGKLDLREWFRFAERRVPQLVAQASGAARELVLSTSAESSTQRPRLFYPVERARSSWIVATVGDRMTFRAPD